MEIRGLCLERGICAGHVALMAMSESKRTPPLSASGG
jgi:hypothetical protein